jgi:2-polyprenyl-6-methoxyphenol hydroxylase-like FAD-dependent oxidoreductase
LIYDAIVIGGGPAGGTSALLLAKAGWSVAVVEKAAFPRRKVCGEFISATTLPLLEGLGVAESFLGMAGPEVRRVGFFAGETVVSAPMPQTRGGRFRWGHALGREHLDLMVLDAAVKAGAELFQPFTAADLAHDGKNYRCRITSDGESRDLIGRVVIAANGSWERGPLSPKAPPHRDSDLLGFKAHFKGASLPADLMPMLVFRGGYAGLVHTDGGRVSLSCCIRRDQLKKSRATLPGQSAGEAVLQHIARSCRGAREALASASVDGPWLSAGPIRPASIRPPAMAPTLPETWPGKPTRSSPRESAWPSSPPGCSAAVSSPAAPRRQAIWAAAFARPTNGIGSVCSVPASAPRWP